LLSIFLLLLACWRIAGHCFPETPARWGAVLLVGATLTVPVAGTALFILDPYLNPRSLSAPAILFALASALGRRYFRTVLWLIATALIHPLMAVFGVAYLIALQLPLISKTFALALIPIGLIFLACSPPAKPTATAWIFRRTRFSSWRGGRGMSGLASLRQWFCSYSIVPSRGRRLAVFGDARFGAAGLRAGVLRGGARDHDSEKHGELGIFAADARIAPSVHSVFPVYRRPAGRVCAAARVWRWLLLLIPLCGAMYCVQRQSFRRVRTWSGPGWFPRTTGCRTFAWIRGNTPEEAYFALDPDHMNARGEDEHGFRALAERSMLADRVKDSGAVTMFPRMAEEWRRQVERRRDGRISSGPISSAYGSSFGVTWFVVQPGGTRDWRVFIRTHSQGLPFGLSVSSVPN